MNQYKMTTRIIIFAVLMCTGLAIRADDTNPDATLGSENLLLYSQGIEQGKEQAHSDLSNNIVRIYMIVFPGPIFQRQKLILKEKYSVELESVGDVRPPPPRDGYLTGYNKEVSAFLKERYGKDVLSETQVQAEQETK